MSIKLMASCWELDIGSTEKMVLMCLCDFADDEGGNCWPSIATLARKCSKSDRTVQMAIKSLAADGFLTTTDAPGKSHSFRLDPRKICTPAKTAPPKKTTQTPAKSAPKPPRTTIKPKEARARELPTDWLPSEFGEETESRKVVAGWPPGERERQLETFCAHHRARGNKFKDWQQAWSTWVLNSRKFSNGGDIRRGGPTGPDKRSGLARAIDGELGALSAFP